MNTKNCLTVEKQATQKKWKSKHRTERMRSISNIDFFCNNNFVAARFLIENNNNEKILFCGSFV